VDAKLRGDPFAEVKLVHVPGSNYAADREAPQDELDNLPRRRPTRAMEQAERERLWAELDAIPEQDESPKQVPMMTGRTWGQAYAAMTQMERIGYMRSGKFKMVVTGARRDGHIEQVWSSVGAALHAEWLIEDSSFDE
jgi:hypothetical protein